MINLNHLRIFYFVAKNLSCTKAANELFITQPAVTAQVKLFEEWCELKFFKKAGKNILLTEEGKALYSHTCKLFEYESKIENVIDDLRHLKQGILRMGTTKTYVRRLMPFLSQHFSKKYQKIRICLDEGSSLDIIKSLTQLRNEIAIVTKVIDDPAIVFYPFTKEELVPILSVKHPLASKEYLSIEELAKEPIILRETGSGTRKYVNELFEQNHCKPNIVMETVNSEFIKQLVARGDGVSILVKEAVKEELRQGKLATVPFKGKRVYLDACVAHLKNQPLSPAARAFLQVLNELVAEEKRPIMGIESLLSEQRLHLNVENVNPYGFLDYSVG